MGNLVRKRTQILLNAVDADSIRYAVGAPLAIKDYNQILVTDTILKFDKTKTTAGTAMVDTLAVAIAYPNAATDGAELHVTLSGRENLGLANGAGRADAFYLSGITFQGYLESLAAASAGMLAAADVQKLIDQVVIQINSHPFFGSRITASRSVSNLVLTAKSAVFQFETIVSQKYGVLTHTTAGVYPKLTLADVQRLFPITAYMVGTGGANIPSASVTDWSRYYFRVEKGPAYDLVGANHTDGYVEEFEFYIPTAVAEAATGLNWDEKIYDFLTARSYSDPHGVASPWGLLFTV